MRSLDCSPSFMPGSKLLIAGLLVTLAACSPGTSGGAKACPPDLMAYVSLDVRARPDDPMGMTAQSTLAYLAKEKLPSSGFYLSRKPLTSNGEKVEYELIHESGFEKPCAVRNKSGFDGVLEIDPATRQVKQLVRYQ